MSLTQEQLKQLVHYDPECGQFSWIVSPCRKVKAGDKAGGINASGYHATKIKYKTYATHRLAWLYVHGVWPHLDIDHINGVKTDNRIENLRLANDSQNKQNTKKCNKNNKTGFLGVNFANNSYKAFIMINRKQIYLGSFDAPEKAHEVYLAAKRELHPRGTL